MRSAGVPGARPRRSAIPAGPIKRMLTNRGRFCRGSLLTKISSPDVRIDGNSPLKAGSYAALGRRVDAGASFAPEMGPAANRAPATPALAGMTGIEALIALQAADDVTVARRKALRRGHQLLDTLDEVKADLLSGHVSEGKLNQLLALLGQAREHTSPGLDSALADVELRARVELAKFGLYAAA